MIKLPETAGFQFRWTNPNNDKVPASETNWKDVVPAWNQTIPQKFDELLSYRYRDKPVYEVRELVTLESAKQAVRDAYEDAANLCCNDHDCGAIRALIKEIDA